jgi:hypothetical protein
MQGKAMSDNEWIGSVINDAGNSCGMAFLIDANTVITCAHVVNVALGRKERDSSNPGSEERLTIGFPSGEKRKAWIKKWFAPGQNDICVLGLTAPTIQKNYAPPLSNAKEGQEFLAFIGTGPSNPPQVGCGVISVSVGGGYFQVVSSAKRPFIREGFSGGPVLSPKASSILGMVARVNEQDKSGHIVSSQSILKAYPEAGRKERRWPTWATLALIATLAVALGATIWFFSGQKIQITKGETRAAERASPSSAIVSGSCPDGTVIVAYYCHIDRGGGSMQNIGVSPLGGEDAARTPTGAPAGNVFSCTWNNVVDEKEVKFAAHGYALCAQIKRN